MGHRRDVPLPGRPGQSFLALSLDPERARSPQSLTTQDVAMLQVPGVHFHLQFFQLSHQPIDGNRIRHRVLA